MSRGPASVWILSPPTKDIIMRPLFSSESDLIYAMLAHASDPMHSLSAEQRKAIAARVPELKVYKHCGCGTCPTVYLTAGEEPPEPRRDANGKVVRKAPITCSPPIAPRRWCCFTSQAEFRWSSKSLLSTTTRSNFLGPNSSCFKGFSCRRYEEIGRLVA